MSIRRAITLGVLALSALALLLIARFGSSPDLEALGYRAFPEPRPIPGFALTDDLEQPFTNDRLRGHWSIVFFGYASCPDICPVTMSVLKQVDVPANAPEVVLVSVDPERDTPPVLHEYVAHFSDAFVGVTGEVEAIRAFAQSLGAGFIKEETDSEHYLVDHTGYLSVVDPNGAFRGFISPPFDAGRISAIMAHLATENRR